MIDLKITSDPLAVDHCFNKINDPTCGGVDLFAGTVRNHTNNKKVVRLEYEAYESMALSEMQKIADHAIGQWNIKNILIHHRTGTLHIGDIAVIIAATAPHRQAAFDACRYAINTLKQTVPIWKKEIFEDGEEWISAHA